MIGRRRVLGGLVMAGFGGNPPMRKDQALNLPVSRSGSGPAPQSPIVRALQVITGPPGGPQVIIDSTLNLAVTTFMSGSSAPAADVASISNLRNVIRMPTGLASEVSPGIIGPVQITYTDGSTADAMLRLGGQGTSLNGEFDLMISTSSTGSKVGGLISGLYTLAGTTVTLHPLSVLSDVDGSLAFYFAQVAVGISGVRFKNPSGTNLIPGDETWHSLGSTGLAGDGGVAQFQLTGDGFLHLSVHKSFTALGGPASPTFANALGSLYIPPASRLTGGVPISTDANPGRTDTRLAINGGTGVVSLLNLATGASVAGCDVRIPLT